MPYSIGIDFGTQSGRVVLLDLASGLEAAMAVVPYSHGVIDKRLPVTGEKLPVDWALQHPADYIEVVQKGIFEVMKCANIPPSEVIGLGVDFTSCTVLPVTEDGTPLCTLPEWQSHPHAWPKLWKHHSAQPIADRITSIAESRNEPFLSRYGGRISSEWYFPKLLEIFEEDRAVYNACSRFLEATDWLVWYLTGCEMRNSCTAGYKAMWSETDGIPGNDFFQEVHPEFLNPSEKLGNVFYPLGTRAGFIREDLAMQLGLHTNVAVAVGNVDAMVCAPSIGANSKAVFVMVMGTSICHLAVADEEIRMPGITGVVKDGILPGMFGYEAGQAAVGDMFEWMVQTAVPPAFLDEARAKGESIYSCLEKLAGPLLPGESGLVALDWWNGNRSILSDADLSGLIAGLTLSTNAQEIYRALLESTAFGTRRIIENFGSYGVHFRELAACGGLAQKSPLLMQIYADVCGLPVTVWDSLEVPARGSALFGAVAAGNEAGGFYSILEASAKLAPPVLCVYHPNPIHQRIYDEIYALYRELYSYFGGNNANWMHQLKKIRLKSRG